MKDRLLRRMGRTPLSDKVVETIRELQEARPNGVYALDIRTRLNQRYPAGGLLRRKIGAGRLYPTLSWLEEGGRIQSDFEGTQYPRRRVYKLPDVDEQR